MARRKNSARWELPGGVVDTVRGICRDYERKRQALICDELAPEVKSLYEQYNGAVNSALLMIEDGLRFIILDDIATGRGYEKSTAALYISHNGYAERKCRLIYNIAINLHFV